MRPPVLFAHSAAHSSPTMQNKSNPSGLPLPISVSHLHLPDCWQINFHKIVRATSYLLSPSFCDPSAFKNPTTQNIDLKKHWHQNKIWSFASNCPFHEPLYAMKASASSSQRKSWSCVNFSPLSLCWQARHCSSCNNQTSGKNQPSCCFCFLFFFFVCVCVCLLFFLNY